MDDEQVTRLPQTSMAIIQKKGAAGTNDLRALMLAGQALIDGGQAINAEMLAFWQSRLKAGLATGGQLLECSSAESALEVHLDHAKATLQAYLDQSARITGLLRQALDAGFRPEQGGPRARPALWSPDQLLGARLRRAAPVG